MPIPRKSTIFPYKPVLTEQNLPDQKGKVFIVTGGSGGLGKELAAILYQHNAKVYLAARSESKTAELIKEIQQAHLNSSGELLFHLLRLDDLTTIKSSAQQFLARESRLDVLWNNAGVMVPPQGSKTVQGYEVQLGTNNLDYHREEGIWTKYSRSKAGNVLHAIEYARRARSQGIISMCLNPGIFVTNLQQSMPKIQLAILISHAPINGAYTELFAGLHPSITQENNGGWVSPFGKLEPVRKDLLDKDLCRTYWQWSETQVTPYM